ncbi:hypothetical protein ABB37_04932 [Leptomonas pyrrhocoris]|uniref:Uncharacterized protein n=1 Tax=Leptomonas pyrrhocoris TaxID=157538 RepID=A0A0M9G0E7_LEPPY|nr:hypothetical protein ABB37_04932 [Leptomonas pyrrhocoris]KPA79850.1 hypothetical protein ABB37_04932 [Leptomonas pyrrhocoris]|eukprot:XP_015658289.1 hypothetical protein ABB37_04932 [Leptomonas pyrrhocoris]
MAERGRTAMAVEVQTTSLWQRRENCPRGAEQRRAVRDYLYRMNILSSMDFAIEKEESEGAVDVSAAFADAVMNGTALCQLVSTLLLEGDEPLRRDAVPCRCPRTLGEVRVNYAQALSALRGAPPAAQGHMPSSTWSILPEDVFFKSTPTALLELLVHLISTYLPSPEELPAWKRPMCWQPSADRAAFSLLSPLKLSAAEAECCAFLHTCGVFPDAALYRLPGPECLLPSPLAAPFMADWKTYVARIDAPPCLLLPSVWPFLCNGVLLVLLARRSGAEAAACAVEPASRGTFFDNPRTVSCCMANISAAFRIFRAVSVHQSSLQFFTAESAAAVLRGDRLHIVTLLLQLRAELEGTPRRTPSSLLLPPSRSARRKKSPAAARDDEPPHQAALAGASAATPSFQQTPTAAHSRSSFAASPPTSLTLRRLEPATVAKNVARRHSTASDSGSAAPSRSPSVHFDPGLGLDNKSNSAPSSKQQETRRALRSEDNAVSQWLRCLVGPGFRYTAIDQSFSFDARHFALSQPCPIFSDGVLLAHVIGLLERRRCDYLDCVQPATKKAAKLFNVRRCLAFLRSSAGVVWELSLLDEALVNGSAEGVLSLLRALRGHYGLARNSNLLCSEEMVMATASAA